MTSIIINIAISASATVVSLAVVIEMSAAQYSLWWSAKAMVCELAVGRKLRVAMVTAALRIATKPRLGLRLLLLGTAGGQGSQIDRSHQRKHTHLKY